MKIFKRKITLFDIYRIKVAAGMGLITTVTTFLYFLLTDNIDTEWYWALILGFKLGMATGILEEFVFTRLFNKYPFVLMVILRAFIYIFIVSWAYIGLEIFNAILSGENILYSLSNSFNNTLLINATYTLMCFDFLIFFNQLRKFLGPGRIISLWTGKYRYPVREHRIFLFLDITSSTEISEQLNRKDYFSFINEFFHDVTEPVLKHGASIYQYVGDEVVFTWPLERGLLDNNCINLFFTLEQVIKENQKKYIDKFRVIPKFKGGLHCGEVITAEVGDLKKEIIHNGEVLNIAARIRSACNKFEAKLLISDKLHQLLDIDERYLSEKIGDIALRGSSESVVLHSLLKNIPLQKTSNIRSIN